MRVIRSKKKTYPDGREIVYVYTEKMIVGSSSVINNSGGFGEVEPLTAEEEAEKRELERMKKIYQVRDKIKDYCLSNEFTYFWTITFKDNRYDDELCFERLQKWLAKMRRKYGLFDYIFIPERHKDGAIHFHGLTGGFKGVISDSGVKHQGSIVYNCIDWEYGFSTLTEIRDKKKTSVYVTKYITKDMMNTPVRKGKKKYWCSRGLRLPVIEYSEKNLGSENGMIPKWQSEDGNITILEKTID